MPKISEWLIERGVQRLRSEDQDRCREEWKAGLDALPNTIIKLVHALSYLGAARRINADFFENRFTKISALIEECDCKHSSFVVRFHVAKVELGRSREELVLQVSNLKARVMEMPNQEVASSFDCVVRLVDACASGVGRSAELLAVCLDRTTERLNHINGLIHRASKKRDQVAELLARRDVSPSMLDILLAELACDLRAVKNTIGDDKWGDDDAFDAYREHERILPAIEGAVRSVTQILDQKGSK